MTKDIWKTIFQNGWVAYNPRTGEAVGRLRPEHAQEEANRRTVKSFADYACIHELEWTAGTKTTTSRHALMPSDVFGKHRELTFCDRKVSNPIYDGNIHDRVRCPHCLHQLVEINEGFVPEYDIEGLMADGFMVLAIELIELNNIAYEQHLELLRELS